MVGNKLSKVDRAELARCLAKAAAYADCGKREEAAEWARQLVVLLGATRILACPTWVAKVDLRRDGERYADANACGFDGGDGIG